MASEKALCIFCRQAHHETAEQKFRRALESHLSKYKPSQRKRMLSRLIRRLEKDAD